MGHNSATAIGAFFQILSSNNQIVHRTTGSEIGVDHQQLLQKHYQLVVVFLLVVWGIEDAYSNGNINNINVDDRSLTMDWYGLIKNLGWAYCGE
jgi:hypothetical protein